MSTKKPTTGRSNAVESHQLEDGAFELVVDEVSAESMGTSARAARSGSSAGAGAGGRGKAKFAILGGAAVLSIGALVAATVVFSGNQADVPSHDAELDEVPSFRPYDGRGGAAAPVPRANPRQHKDGSGWQVEERGDEILVNGEPVEADWRITETDVIGKEIDGERIIADSKGEPMSKIEAEIRAKKMVESIDNAEYEFERRGRIRDALNSRIMVPSREGIGRVELAPGVNLGANLQEQVLKRYGATGEALEARGEEGEFVGEEYYDEADEAYYDDEVYPEDEDYLEDETWEDPTY